MGIGALLVTVVVAGGYHFGGPAIEQWLQRPVARVAVEGEFRYMTRERVSEVIANELTEDFLKLNLGRMKRVLEREPWVERAALVRRWPDTLEVRIYEQQPIARWGDRGFLNQRGEIIELEDNRVLDNLTWLEGDDRHALHMMQRYQDLSRLMRSRGLVIARLAQDDKRAWRMQLSDGIEVAIGRDQLMEKVQRFLTIYDRYLDERWDQVVGIDVRYSNGVAVRWHSDNDE